MKIYKDLAIAVILPLISSAICNFFGFLLGFTGALTVLLGVIILTFLLASNIVLHTGKHYTIAYIKVCGWASMQSFCPPLNLLCDNFSTSMLLTVVSISTLVHVYSVYYMQADPNKLRFISLLSVFTFFMLVLLATPSMLLLFFGWEGVGICSYLLINFWYTRPQANKAAIKAIIINRVGDAALLVGIIISISIFGTLNLNTTPFSEDIISKSVNLKFLLLFMLLIAIFAKSAQFGLHTWLPDAMEGPTPVSALIHAATMVTAGVLLALKSASIMEQSNNILLILSAFGATTALYAGSLGVFQKDIKKIIAYSTCSQLGYMIFALGLSQYALAYYHLINHAFFKALLFLASGAVIHCLYDEQDIRRMGGTHKRFKLELSYFLAASLALVGFPFFTGFYSKDLIIEFSYTHHNQIGYYVYFAGIAAAVLTAIYSIKIIFYTFFSGSNFLKGFLKKAVYNYNLMQIPLIILAFLSISFGKNAKEFFRSDFNFSENFENFLARTQIFEPELVPPIIKLIPLMCIFIGTLVFFNIRKKKKTLLLLKNLYNLNFFFSNKWYFDDVYNKFIAKNILGFSFNYVLTSIDRGFLEIMGPQGLNLFWSKLSYIISNTNSGELQLLFRTVILSFTLTIIFVII